MTLAPSRCLSQALLLPLLAVILGGCGDGIVDFSMSDPPPGSAGSAGTSASGHGGTGSSTQVYQPGGKGGGGSGGSGATAAGAIGGDGDEPVTGVPVGGEAAIGEPSPGSGGAPDEPAMVLDLIDDVEGAFPSLPSRSGRDGTWFAVHDNSYGQVTPASAFALDPARGASHYAAGIKGSGFTDWGAQVGVSLKSPSSAYDASDYCGVRFLVKGSGSGWTFLISDRLSVPQGGVCDALNWDSDQGCYQFVGKGLAVGNVWQEVLIRFDELRLVRDTQSPRRLDRSALYDILFNVHNPAGGSFELMIDDLSFIEQGSLACQH